MHAEERIEKTSAHTASRRLQSLDTFRGLTIALMILVNMPGSWSHVYPPLRHAEWFGWTPTDLVFPFFLFIVGVSMTFSMAARRSRGATRGHLYRHIWLRSAIIFALGLLINFYPAFDPASLRITGVLQRIAVAYLITAYIVCHAGVRAQAWITAAVLVAYWGLMSLVPVPGHGHGDLTVGGNLAGWLDRALLGAHGYRHSLTDPEGLLSTLPSIATVLIGVLTGHFLRSGRDRRDIVGWMYFAGWLSILAGLFWGIWFPISKKLWTSSYVLFTSGAALQLLAVCYWLIEVKGWRRWARPAMIFGTNAIAAYVLHILAIRTLLKVFASTASDGSTSTAYAWIYEHLFASWAGAWNGSLAFAVANVLFWFGVLAILYRQRIFLKV